MKVKIDLKIFLIVVFYLLTRNIKVFAITLLFIFIHELGHLLTGIILGLKLSKIHINILGFSIEFENYGKARKINKIIIDLAGPIANLIIFIIAMFLKLEEITYINLILLIVNMLPICPLDGGRILKNIILYKNSYKKAIKITENISKNTLIILTLLASIFILVFKNISIFILIIYLWSIYIKEYNKNRIIKRAYQTIKNNS